MPSATRELLASPETVWGFLAEPHHLADWWPGIAAVEPDRRGFAPGARWRVQRRGRRGLLPAGAGWNGPTRTETLLIDAVAPEREWRFALIPAGGRLRARGPVRVAVALAAVPARPDRTALRVEVDTGGLGREAKATAQTAAARLHELLQTAAES
jgi:hypothetical protein